MSSFSLRLGVALSLLVAALWACSEPTHPEPEEGLTWLESPARPGAMTPRWAEDANAGDPLLSWLEPSRGDALALKVARYETGGWGEISTVVESSDFFANWADFPALAITRDGTTYAHWLARNGEETYAYGVELARSSDGGRSWRSLGSLHPDDPSPTEHGFVSWVPGASGLRAFWLDGRQMADGGPMTVRTAQVGESVGPGRVLDERVCECCQTAAVAAPDADVFFYRDRTNEEVRDISVLRVGAESQSVTSSSFDDGWKIPGCPVNGPAAAAEGERLAVAWFTGAEPGARVQLAFSDDGGRSFGEPQRVDDGKPLGRVDVVMAADGSAIVSWLEVVGEGAEIRLRRVASDGTPGESFPVAETSPARSSGFPQMTLPGEALFLAWREIGTEDEPSRLRLARLPVSNL